MKYGSEIKERHDLDTHLNFKRDFTGSFENIWTMTSRGSCGGCESLIIGLVVLEQLIFLGLGGGLYDSLVLFGTVERGSPLPIAIVAAIAIALSLFCVG